MNVALVVGDLKQILCCSHTEYAKKFTQLSCMQYLDTAHTCLFIYAMSICTKFELIM